MKLFKHLKTIRTHRRAVRKMCFKMGIPLRGILHDLSKYSLTELKICKYWTGKGSPHQTCRETIGYSPSWIHHYHKNKHHFQYWWDEDEDGNIIPIKMPYKYLIESFCDMIGAGRAYLKKKWTAESTWSYWMDHCKGKRIMNKESESLLEELIWQLKKKGLNEFIKWYKTNKKHIKFIYEQGASAIEEFRNEINLYK